MKISDADVTHCETYALGVTFDHEHVEACERFTKLLAFFDNPFASFISFIVIKQLSDDQIGPEINTMINAVTHFTLRDKHYTGHRVRYMLKFDMI